MAHRGQKKGKYSTVWYEHRSGKRIIGKAETHACDRKSSVCGDALNLRETKKQSAVFHTLQNRGPKVSRSHTRRCKTTLLVRLRKDLVLNSLFDTLVRNVIPRW